MSYLPYLQQLRCSTSVLSKDFPVQSQILTFLFFHCGHVASLLTWICRWWFIDNKALVGVLHCTQKTNFIFPFSVFEEVSSPVACHVTPTPGVSWSSFHLLSLSFFRQAEKMYFLPLLRPSPFVGIISRLRMQFHTTVSQRKVHSAPIGLVMWNQKPPEKMTVSMPKAMEHAFKAYVKHRLCSQKFYFNC